MNNKYGVVKQEYELGEERRVSYGIAAYEESEEGNKKIVCTVSDVCEDYDKISAFINLCNEQELSVIHIEDVINDFLFSLKN